MLKFRITNTKEFPSKMSGFFRFIPDENEVAVLMLPSQRTVCGHFVFLLETIFRDLYEERPELFDWFRENTERYMKNPAYGMWSSEPWILTDKIDHYVCLEGLVRPHEDGTDVNFNWGYAENKENLMFAMMILIQNGYYNVAIRDPKMAKLFKENISDMVCRRHGVFDDIKGEFGDDDDDREIFELEYESYWHDKLWDFEAFDPNLVCECKDYEDYLRIFNRTLIDGHWLLMSDDWFWEDFLGVRYVEEGVIQPNMSKKEIWDQQCLHRFGFLPVQFETLNEAIDCVKDRFQSFNEAQIKAGLTDEIMHFTQRFISDDIVCLDAPIDWIDRWHSFPCPADLSGVFDLFAIRVSEKTRKQISDYLLHKRECATEFFGID